MRLSRSREEPSLRKGLESGFLVFLFSEVDLIWVKVIGSEDCACCWPRPSVPWRDWSQSGWHKQAQLAGGMWAMQKCVELQLAVPGDLERPGGCLPQHREDWGGRAWDRGSETVWISLGQRGRLFANSGSNGAVLKNIPIPGASHGPKRGPCCPAPRHGPAPAMAAPGAGLSPSTRQLWLGLGSRTASPTPPLLTTIPGTSYCHHQSQGSLSWKRREGLLFTLEGFYNPFCYCRSHTKDNLCQFFSDPYSDIFPGLILILLAANAGTLSFLLCSLLSHGYPSKINYLQQNLSLEHCSI